MKGDFEYVGPLLSEKQRIDKAVADAIVAHDKFWWETFTARDRWWMQQVERMGMSRNLETYVYGNDKFKDDYICIRFTDWQSLKQSVEVKE